MEWQRISLQECIINSNKRRILDLSRGNVSQLMTGTLCLHLVETEHTTLLSYKKHFLLATGRRGQPKNRIHQALARRSMPQDTVRRSWAAGYQAWTEHDRSRFSLTNSHSD